MARTEFDHDQFAEAYPPGIERSWWSLARNHVIARMFARHLSKDARILEVGCGTGIATAHLRKLGWNITGVDLGQPENGVLDRDHLLLGTNALELPTEMRSTFTALALFDVIEHITDAPSFLRELLTAFPNARHVVVTVPARKELWTSFDDHYGHFRRYDLGLLEDEFKQAGLWNVKASYFFHALYIAIGWNNILRGRKRNLVFKAPAPGLATTMNAAVARGFVWDARFFPGFVPGSSIIGIAQRA